jgi:hypothetical protein
VSGLTSLVRAVVAAQDRAKLIFLGGGSMLVRRGRRGAGERGGKLPCFPGGSLGYFPAVSSWSHSV